MTLEFLTAVHGIGPELARQLYKRGVRTLSALRLPENWKTLPLSTRTHLTHHPLSDIPRSVMQKYHKRLIVALRGRKFCIMGSYRRGADVSHDIDLLVGMGRHTDPILCMTAIIKRLSVIPHLKKLVLYARGPQKSTMLIKVDNLPCVKLDLWIGSAEDYTSMLLYGTGSRIHNIRMRARAHKMGLLLNRRGLWRADGSKVPCGTERDYFRALKMQWRAPTQRN